MALVTLTDVFANLDNWPGNLFAASDGSTIVAHTATRFAYTFLAGTNFAGFTVTATGTGFAYDGTTPTAGAMQALTITDAGGNIVMTVANIAAKSLASDLSLFAAYEFGWTDPDGNVVNSQQSNAWSLLLSGKDTINGTSGNDNKGFAGVDAGNDIYNMGAGDDRVNGGLGNDTINGGDGWDGLSFEQTTWNEGLPMVRGITVNVAAGTVLDPYGYTDHFTGLEWISGSAFNDVFKGSATTEMTFRGLRGVDTFIAGSQNDWAEYGDDAWSGGKRGILANLATGISGTDILGTIRDGFGNLDKTVNLQSVAGTRFNDTFNGSDADNSFAGGEGKDSYNGGGGIDELVFNWWFTDAQQHGIVVNLSLLSGQILDDGFGNKENAASIENVGGTSHNDQIIGAVGTNVFQGREGADTLAGGGGADEFRWNHFSEIGGNDVVTDFHAGAGADQDKIGLRVTEWGGTTTLHLVNGAAATDAVGTVIFNQATHVLSWDADGTGAGVAIDIVTLNGVAALTAANILLA